MTWLAFSLNGYKIRIGIVIVPKSVIRLLYLVLIGLQLQYVWIEEIGGEGKLLLDTNFLRRGI